MVCQVATPPEDEAAVIEDLFFFLLKSVTQMPNICVRTEENSCSVSSSSFTPSDAASSEVLDSRNVFLELHYVGLENGKLLAPNKDWLRYFCETQLLSPGTIKGSLQLWKKKTQDNNNSTSVNKAGRKLTALTHQCQPQINIREKFADWR